MEWKLSWISRVFGLQAHNLRLKATVHKFQEKINFSFSLFVRGSASLLCMLQYDRSSSMTPYPPPWFSPPPRWPLTPISLWWWKKEQIHQRRTRKKAKQRRRSSGRSKQKPSGDDVAGFPLSNTKTSTVYHGFHGLDSNIHPPLPSSSGLSQQPDRLLLLGGKWCQWISKWLGGGEAVGDALSQDPAYLMSETVCVCWCVCARVTSPRQCGTDWGWYAIRLLSVSLSCWLIIFCTITAMHYLLYRQLCARACVCLCVQLERLKSVRANY